MPFRARFRSALLLATLIMLALISGCTDREKPQAPPPVPVSVVKAEARDALRTIKGVGTVKASNSVTLKPQVSGQILRIHFLDGDHVRAGQLMYTIDPESYVFTQKGAQADVARDRAQAEMAQKDYLRFKSLYDQGVVSRDEFEQKQTAYESAHKAMEADLAQAGIAGRNVTFTRVTSPIDGIAGSTLLDEGNLVSQDSTELVSVKTVSPADVVFSIPGRYLKLVRGHVVDEDLTVTAEVSGMENDPATGQLTFVDNWVNPATAMINLKARFPNKDQRLWPGQFVAVTLILSTIPNAVHLPSQSVQKGPDGHYVFVVEQDKAAMRPVQVLQRDNDEVVLKQGVKPGETVVADGMFRLHPGAVVSIVPDTKQDGTQEKETETARGHDTGDSDDASGPETQDGSDKGGS